MSIREEFEKAFQERFHDEPECCQPKVVALWAAKWMAEKISKMNCIGPYAEEEIRQLAKELSNDH